MTDDTAHRAKLVRMANQISASVPDATHAADQTASHLRMFWAPSMVDELAVAAHEDPAAVTPAVRAALSALRPQSAGMC